MINDNFSWVKTHKQLVQYLLTKEDSQKDLVSLLKSVGITPFNDKANYGEHDIELEEIDPFTFFCYIYKYGSEKRLKFLQEISEKLNLDFPKGESGIPSAQAQKVWMFPYQYERKNNEVSRLWSFFKKAVNNKITDQDFEDILKIRSTGKVKITEALFYIDPERYFPINGPTKPYLKEVLNIDPNFNTFSEYLTILEKIKESINVAFYEISFNAWKWNDERKNVNYWIFQGNPKVFDFETALRNEILTDWTVSSHKDKIKIGDKVILWITGSNSGCYAFAEITSEPSKKTSSPDDHLWKSTDKSEYKAGLKIIQNLIENPILKKEINSHEELNNLKVGSQGINFSATQIEYETLIQMASNNTNIIFEVFIKQFDSLDLKKYFDFLKEIVNHFNLKPNDKRLVFNLHTNYDYLSLTIGQRYCLILSKNEIKGKFGFISKDKLFDNSVPFKGKTPTPFFTRLNDFNLDEKHKQNVFEAIEIELNKTTKSGYRKFNKTEFEKIIFHDFFEKNYTKTNNDILNTMNDIPQNIILYGPPGTGKTYKLKNEYFSNYTLKENSISPEANFEDVVSVLTWWQVIALALLEIGTNKVNDILENRWVAKKAQLSESKNVRATIWGTLQMHTIVDSKTVNYTQRQTPFIFDKTEDKKWQLFENDLKEQAPEIYDILDSVNNFKPNPNKEIKHYVFTTFHQSFSYEDFIEGIKPVMEEGQENVTYKIENGVFKELCLRAQNDPTNKYAIFIDEINRGNVSQIFGELITLIEHDKRIGASNEIKVKLPYSKKEFGVPMNIDIIGTMNTADRSVESLDTALRRRFSFVEMMPDEKVFSSLNFTDTYARKSIMQKINQRIEVLLDRNYTLGHSYFIKDDFKNSFENEVIPLLQEYFYNDYGKIGLVLGKGFVREKTITAKNDKSIFADFDTKNEVDITKSYELIPFAEINFDEAILTLLV